jgi:hypothetical protein
MRPTLCRRRLRLGRPRTAARGAARRQLPLSRRRTAARGAATPWNFMSTIRRENILRESLKHIPTEWYIARKILIATLHDMIPWTTDNCLVDSLFDCEESWHTIQNASDW